MNYHDYGIGEQTELQKYVLALYFTNRRPFAVKIIGFINIFIFSKWISEKVATNACFIVNIAIYALAQPLLEPQMNIVVVMVHVKQHVHKIHVRMLHVNVIWVGPGINVKTVKNCFLGIYFKTILL